MNSLNASFPLGDKIAKGGNILLGMDIDPLVVALDEVSNNSIGNNIDDH